MTAIKTFPKAPIAEAIFDIRVRLPDNIDIEVLEGIHKEVIDRFPAKEQKYAIQTELKVPSQDELASGGVQSLTKTDSLGFMFKSDLSKKIFQSRLDGFTFNKLKPYENWEVFFAEAKELWAIYKKHAQPVDITRIALRYVNKIHLPLPIETFDDYVCIAPKLPEAVPQGLSGFFTQYSVPNDDIGAMDDITQTMEPPTNDNTLPYILDIDVSKQSNFSDEDPSFWDNFNELRNYKNQIFFNCLTSKAKDLFE